MMRVWVLLCLLSFFIFGIFLRQNQSNSYSLAIIEEQQSILKPAKYSDYLIQVVERVFNSKCSLHNYLI